MDSRAIKDNYRIPLCPYLAVGNSKVLVHLDAYCVPQSLQWPSPGSPDRLGWRDRFDEWPYWDELSEDVVRTCMPYFEYLDGTKDYLHEASDVYVDYLEDTNVLAGRYLLPRGAVVEITTYVLPFADVWAREYKVSGNGRFVMQGEFFRRAVRGLRGAHLGHIDFKGAFDAAPTGVYLIVSTLQLDQKDGRVEIEVAGECCWVSYLCIADDLVSAVALSETTLSKEPSAWKWEAITADVDWVSRARMPQSEHLFIERNYRRWLLANRLCLSDDGVMLASPRPFWSFIWPRDASLCAAGFAAAGFAREAQNIMKWLLSVMPESLIHDARYFADGQPMLLDNRMRQGDNPGYVAWATAFTCRQEWDARFVDKVRDKLFRIADHLVSSVDPETLLPNPEADYWETHVAESISIANSAMGGLLGAAYVAGRLGLQDRSLRYKKRALEIQKAVRNHLWNPEDEYIMMSTKPVKTDTDVAICLGIHPFQAWDADDEMVVKSINAVRQHRWNEAAGGMLCGEGTEYESFWFYHTSLLLLGVASIGDTDTESAILESLGRNVCPQGLVPEQVSSRNGHLWGGNYLATAQGCLLLYAYRNDPHGSESGVEL